MPCAMAWAPPSLNCKWRPIPPRFRSRTTDLESIRMMPNGYSRLSTDHRAPVRKVRGWVWPLCAKSPGHMAHGGACPAVRIFPARVLQWCFRGRGSGHNYADKNRRSEEHTSELQTLMRKSYSDFCLKN